MPASALRGLERFVSDSCKAYCYQLVHEWQRGNGSQYLIDICHHVERELRLAERFDKTEISLLLKSDTFPAINESILKRFYDEISERVIKVDSILEAVENRRTSGWYHLTADYLESLYHIAKMQEFYLAHIEGFHLVEPRRSGDSIRLMLTKWTAITGISLFFGTLESPQYTPEDVLKKCSDVVEGLYREWFLKELTLNWTNAIAGDLIPRLCF